MTLKTKIDDVNAALNQTLPQFHVDFVLQENLENDKLFNDLTLIYGLDNLLEMQTLRAQYLPDYLQIGNNSGDYGLFISLAQPKKQAENQAENTAIYIVEMGDLDETSLEKLAENFSDLAKKDFDTEIFLENLYHKQDTFRRSQINAPILELKQKISDLNKHLNALSHQKSKGLLDLKSYLLQKKEIDVNKHILDKKLIEHESALLEANKNAASRASPLINTRIIENTYNIKLPLLYKKLAEDGMLQYAEYFGSDWYKNVFPTLKNQPPFLLFAQEFELLSLRNVFEKLREGQERTPEVWSYDWHADFTMIAFAGDGSGDRYAFYDDGNGNEHAIIHWWHDSDHCDIKAKNLQDFIFIKMLDLALEIHPVYDIAADCELKTNLTNMLTTHESYLTASQVIVLKQVYGRYFVEYDGALGAITVDEYKQMLLQEIGYCEDLGHFKYTK